MTTAADLREDLIEARFTVAALRGVWGDAADAALARGHRVPARRALAGHSDPLAVLARIFVLGDAVDAAELEAAVPRAGLTGLRALGLIEAAAVEADADTDTDTDTDAGAAATNAASAVEPDASAAAVSTRLIRPALDLRPYALSDADGAVDWWVVSDLGEQSIGGPLREDHVLGVGGASLTLAGLQLPDYAGSVLDLGTGSGIQALHASRYSDRVVATDISTRALQLAALTAELNGVTIETRLGSLFDPVAPGETFDRVVSNPPFVVTPRVEGVPAYEYRDGGMVGDALVRTVIEGLPDVLAVGGVAQLLGNWEYRDGMDGLDRVRSWIEPTGLDAWVVERERLDPSSYAETWIRDGGTRPGTAGFERLHAAWLDDFEARGVTAVGFGYVLLRKTSGAPTLSRYEVVTTPVDASAVLGAHIAQCLALHDWHTRLTDDELSDAHVTVAGDVTEQRHLWPGDEHPAAIDLRQGGGFGRTYALDTASAGFVGACDGELTVGQIVAALAELLEVPEAALRAEMLPLVRRLLDDGMLLPTEGQSFAG